MKRVNDDIRNTIEKANIKYWRVADSWGLNDGNFSRLLRHELTKEQKEKILQIIKKLKRKD